MNSPLRDATVRAVQGLHTNHLRVLQALLFASNHSASASQLRRLLGLSAIIQVNSAIGQIGRRIHAELGKHPEGLEQGEFEWWHVVATGRNIGTRGFVWTLRQEVVEGLLAFGLQQHGFAQASEVQPQEVLTEGSARQVLVNAYERNPVARARCLEHHGYQCASCGVDFGETYGEAARGYIHVHHIKPLAQIQGEYEVDPVEDLRPVCPNCHAVIHLTNPPRTVEEVKIMVDQRRKTIL